MTGFEKKPKKFKKNQRKQNKQSKTSVLGKFSKGSKQLKTYFIRYFLPIQNIILTVSMILASNR